MFNFTHSVYSVDTPSIQVVREARATGKKVKRGSYLAFTNALRYGEALSELENRRKAGLIVDEATGKPLTQQQLIDYVGGVAKAMFLRYIQAANFSEEKINAYVEQLPKMKTPNVSDLVTHYSEKKAPKGDVESTYTKAKSEGEKGFTVTLYKDGTFTATKGADPEAVEKVVAALEKLKG